MSSLNAVCFSRLLKLDTLYFLILYELLEVAILIVEKYCDITIYHETLFLADPLHYTCFKCGVYHIAALCTFLGFCYIKMHYMYI